MKYKAKKCVLTVLFVIFFILQMASAEKLPAGGSSSLVYPGPDGKLVYTPDEDGNRICDFSYAGYEGGGVAIPDVPAAESITPSGGDDTRRIQAAVDRVGKLPLNEDGFRGAVLLRRGKYTISNTIHIRHSGVVIRGQGAGFGGTWIYHKCMDQIKDPTPGKYVHYPQPDKGIIPTFHTHGKGINSEKIADVVSKLVPAGISKLKLSDVASIKTGQEVVVLCHQTQKWIDALGLTEFWKPQQFVLRFPRVVKSVDVKTKTITLNVPVTSRIDRTNGYSKAEVHKVINDGRIRHVGIEDILFLSGYDRSRRGKRDYFNDENHPNYICRFYGARDGWMRRCVGFFYSSGMVATGGSQHLTIEDCAMLDGISQDTPVNHTGSRKYYFNANGDHILFQRCYSRYARHAFIGNGPFGGVVFLDCYSEKDHLPSEWHQRWGHGHLFDNIYTQAPASVLGFNDNSHGQKAAFSMWWNCLVDNKRLWEQDIRINAQPPLCRNYMAGIIHRGSGKVGHRHNTSVGQLGTIESLGRFVNPRSLYLAQLEERMGKESVQSVAARSQITGGYGAVWQHLIESFSGLPEWADPEKASWEGLGDWIVDFESSNDD